MKAWPVYVPVSVARPASYSLEDVFMQTGRQEELVSNTRDWHSMTSAQSVIRTDNEQAECREKRAITVGTLNIVEISGPSARPGKLLLSYGKLHCRGPCISGI